MQLLRSCLLLPPALLLAAAAGPAARIQDPPGTAAEALPVGGLLFELELPSGPRQTWEAPSATAWVPAGEFVLPEGALVARAIVAPAEDSEAPAEERIELELSGGDRLAARAAGGRGDQILLELGGALLALNIDQIQSLRFSARLPADPGLVLEAPQSGDRLYRRVAQRLDRVDGTLDSLSAEGIAFESLVGRQLIPWEELAAMFIESLDDQKPLPAGPRALVVSLGDGSRLRGELISLDQDRIQLKLPSGDDLALPMALIAQLECADGRLAFLSDLKPVEIDPARPFGDDLGMVWWPRIDLAMHGEPLRAGGRRYYRGFGAGTPTRLAFDLPSGWRELRGSVAVDDSVAALGLSGSVRFKLLVDGQVRFESPEMGRQEAPLELPPILLVGAQRLELITEMASDLFEGDRADWLDLRIVR